MTNTQKDAVSIGRRIGRTMQQFELRRAYAKGQRDLMEEEYMKASAMGQTQKSLQAKISMAQWENYLTNLETKENELIQSVKKALICYNERERTIWWSYFIEHKSSYEIEAAIHLDSRSVQRAVAAMKRDMDLKFDFKLPVVKDGEESAFFSPMQLAEFLEDKPSDDYIEAIKDMLKYGIVDIEALEFDPTFQDFLEGKRP